jgi:outer membrane protein OmpA-like peptidoglycan-associated protein
MSLLTDLFSTLDNRNLSGIADALGEPQQSVSQGMRSALGTVLGGLASNSDNPTLLKGLLDSTSGKDVSWSNLAGGIADPNSPVIGAGKRMLSTLFGGSESTITRALGTGTGLQPNIVTSLLAMAAPMVMNFLGRRVRDEGMSMSGLGSLLQREVPAIRAALPASVSDLLWPRQHETVGASPVVAQTVTKERSSASWLIPLLCLALIPGLWWLFSRHRPVVQTPPSGTANRVVPEVPMAPRTTVIVPRNVDLYFITGSSKLQPRSNARLNEFVGSLASNRDARVMVSGYTDNVGNADSNMQLSQKRADEVKDMLVKDGISPDRITAQGFGEENPIADNATAEGRQTNRRVSVAVGEH